MAGRKVSVAVELTTGDAKAQVAGLRKEFASLGPESEASFKKLSQSSSDAAKVAKESIPTISSELIESLGVDGDIANVFGENIAKMRASTLILGGAVAGVVAGAGALVALTLKLGAAGRELQLSSEAIGLSVEKLQLYARASESAGASAETLTGVFTKFRQETGGNEQAFDSFLKSLEAVKSPAERLAIAQARLGELSDDARRAILALTEQNGELRKSILESGVVLSEVEARELADIDRRFGQLTLKAEGFLKRGVLATIDGLAEFGVALGEGSEGLKRLAEGHAKAEAEARKQKQAVDELRVALNEANETAIKGGIRKRVDSLVETLSARSDRSLTAAEAKRVFQSQVNADPTLNEAIKRARIFEQNRKLLEDLVNPSSKSGGGGGGRSAASELAQLNKELALFVDTSSAAFKQRTQIDDLRNLKSQVEEIIKLRRELGQDQQAGFATQILGGKEVLDPAGIKGQLDFLKALKKEAEETAKTVEKLSVQLLKNNDVRLVPGSAGAVKGEIEATAKLTDILRDSQIRANVETVEAKIATSEYYQELLKTNAAEAESIRLKARQTDAANAQAKQTELLKETTQALREQLEATGDQSTLLRTRRQLRRAGIDPDSADAAEATGLARQLDAQEEYRRAVEESRQANERFRQSVQSLFDALLDSPKRFFDQLKSLAKSFASSTLTNLFLGGNGGGGGGFSFGGGGGGGGFNPLGLLRTPGFNPSAAAGGIGGNGGGFLSQLTGGASNGIFPALAGKATGFLGKLLGFGGGGASTIGSGAVASAKAALGIGASGAGSAAGAAGAAGGGSTLASLGALFTNPITAVVAGAAIGGFFLYRSLRNRDLKKLRELARGQYGVDIKDDSTLKGIREIGKSTFGKDYNNRLAETVALPPVRDLIAQYAENSGQAGNGSLISRARLGDKFDAVNLVKREFGGPVLAGQAYIVGERRPELFIPNQSGRIAPSVNGGGSEMWAAVLGAIQANTMALQTLVTASPNDVLMKADPQAHAAVTRSAFAADYGLVNDLAYQVNR